MQRFDMTTEAQGRAAVRERSQGRCEVCGRADATEWMHRLPRSAGGTWSPANGLDGCGRCHKTIHAHRDPFGAAPTDVYLHGWMVKRGQQPSSIAARLAHPVYGPGWWLLDDTGALLWMKPWAPPFRAMEQLPTRKARPVRG